VPDVIVYHCLLPENITKEALLRRYGSMGYSVVLAGIDPRNTGADIVRLGAKICFRFIRSLFFGLLRNEGKKFKQQKRIAFYKGKIKGIRSFARDERRSKNLD